jgi:hypothetical protein
MTSSSSDPNLPSVQFPEIFETALEEYRKKTEKDIKSDPLFVRLQDCNSSDAVLKVLEEQALAFEQYRSGGRKVQLMKQLKPIVEILSRLFTNDDLKDGVVSVRLTRYNYSLRKFYHSPCRYFHRRRLYLLVLVTYSKYIPSFPAPPVCSLDTQS